MADITTEMLDYATNGSQASGYLARPAGDGPFPGVIVIQEWWGLNDNIKGIAERFAGEGFAAFAPDLYHGKVVAEPDAAQKEMMALDMPRAVEELVKATEYLSTQPYMAGRGIGATGFCMGGGLAMNLAAATPLIKAVVPFYGFTPDPVDKMANINGPLLGIYAEHDAWISEDVRNTLTSALDRAGKRYEVKIYPGTEHAFFNDTNRETYREAAAKDAWERMLTLFRAEL